MEAEMKDSPNVDNACVHCGEDCGKHPVYWEEKPFCCQGCKMVYEILQQNDMCNFYDIDENAGFSLKGRKEQRYDFLDDKEIVEKLIDFQDDTLTSVKFYLPQIHCASCIWLLENLYKFNPAIRSSRVNFMKKEIYLTFTPEMSLRQLVELLASIGYAPEINLGSLEDERPIVEKQFFYKLGLAGFAFGNIMLMSFPEYLGLKESDEWFRNVFGYINILLAIPVLLYSGRDYLRSAWQGLKKGDVNIDVPVSLGMLAIFSRSLYEILSGTGAGYLDSFAGLVFFLLLGKWFQQRTYNQLSFERDYKSYFPISATVLKEGKQKPVALNKLDQGDIILVRHGELIPADSILIKGNALIDYSFVTGEAEPIAKKNGDKVYAGGRQTGDAIEVSVIKKVEKSYLIQLWNNAAFEKEEEGSVSKIADRIGKLFTFVILTVALGALLYWLPKNQSIAITVFTSVLIIACPCAVALSIPFTFGNVLRIMASRQFYLKNTNVVEKIKASTSMIFDKTGTITLAGGGKVDYEGKLLNHEHQHAIFSMTENSLHPLSRQVNDFLKQHIEEEEVKTDFFEEHIGKGIVAKINGHHYRLGSPQFILGDQASKTTTELQLNAEKSVLLEIDGEYYGNFIVINKYRPFVKSVITKLSDFYQLFLLSGDNDREKDKLKPWFGSDQNLLFKQSPQDKLNFVKQLQDKGETVIMMGDGLNDAGALKQSDVGLVVSEDINNFTPASDAILQADQFPQLPKYLLYIRKSINLVYAAYILALIYNVVGLSFAVQGVLSPIVAAILMPASSISIALFGVVSSSILARKILGKPISTQTN